MSNNPISINDRDAARTARNRQNASHSTGPKTEAGKKRSSLNGLRHGLTGHTILLPTEDLDAYQDFTEKFYSIVTEHAEVHAALVIMEALREQTHTFTALGQHGARLSREFERILKQLRQLQQERRATEASQLADAAALFLVQKKKGLTYIPAEDGFAFSNAEIETFIGRRDRLKIALAAA